jgi:hypothetical protein
MLTFLYSFVPLLGIKTIMADPASSLLRLPPQSIHLPSLHAKPQNPLSRNTKSLVESIGGRGILSPQALDCSLGGKTCGLSSRSLCNTADVDQLVADGIGDDVGVQGVFLSLRDGWVDGKEGSFVGLAAWTSEFKGNGWVAGTELGGICSASWDSGCNCSRCCEECEKECLGLHLEIWCKKVNVDGLAGDN